MPPHEAFKRGFDTMVDAPHPLPPDIDAALRSALCDVQNTEYNNVVALEAGGGDEKSENGISESDQAFSELALESAIKPVEEILNRTRELLKSHPRDYHFVGV